MFHVILLSLIILLMFLLFVKKNVTQKRLKLWLKHSTKCVQVTGYVFTWRHQENDKYRDRLPSALYRWQSWKRTKFPSILISIFDSSKQQITRKSSMMHASSIILYHPSSSASSKQNANERKKTKKKHTLPSTILNITHAKHKTWCILCSSVAEKSYKNTDTPKCLRLPCRSMFEKKNQNKNWKINQIGSKQILDPFVEKKNEK